jgi:hypothetical protein
MKVKELLEITDGGTTIELNRLYDTCMVECSGEFTLNSPWRKVEGKVNKYLDREISSIQVAYNNKLQIYVSDREKEQQKL